MRFDIVINATNVCAFNYRGSGGRVSWELEITAAFIGSFSVSIVANSPNVRCKNFPYFTTRQFHRTEFPPRDGAIFLPGPSPLAEEIEPFFMTTVCSRWVLYWSLTNCTWSTLHVFPWSQFTRNQYLFSFFTICVMILCQFWLTLPPIPAHLFAGFQHSSLPPWNICIIYA